MSQYDPGYAPYGYFCPVCGHPQGMPHGEPCEISDHDLELIAAEMAERELPDIQDVATKTYRLIDSGIAITVQVPGPRDITFGDAWIERLLRDE